ncbi:N-acetyltransferase [Streptomyces albofaciens JCM 4342]|uniref:GNAT family N-acetyltransferase n=1 Tax=Streptomyces albofaciens TaxID=66866 RepID=UPI00123B5A6A|nr:GNAT family N-acetyltransferase [Streptomyces albofaciens]KAA6222003.1 N-acetyltransferase [Streptomyces albofaciens JCM 4342]
MRFRWDWLRPQITAPYVPTIGPVHPDTLGQHLFADVVANAPTGRFLPYDKDQRWSDVKAERVLVEDIAHSPSETLLPTLSRRGAGTVSVHLYGTRPDGHDRAADLAVKLCATHDAATGRVVSFAGPEEQPAAQGQVTRVQLHEFGPEHPAHAPEGVRPLTDCPASVQATFPRFAELLADEGFAFLHGRMRAGGVCPVLVAVDEGRVVGAIGPMEVMPDSRGAVRLLPQYFGILPEQRGRGLGRALWRAAMGWGQENGAAYQLLQTEVDGASDHLCRSEGLRSLGFVCVTKV